MEQSSMAVGDGESVQCQDKGPSSSSLMTTKTVNGSHSFTINGYSLAKGVGAGKYMSSDTFSVGGYEWAIYFYPDGKSLEDNSLYVSVFIARVSEGTDVRALFELTLLDQSGREKHKVHSHFTRPPDSGPYTLKYRGSMWGYKRFFRKAVFETSDFLRNDSLEIACTVGVIVSSMQGPTKYAVPVPDSDIGLQIGDLLDSRERTDIAFEVKGENFHAHKLVLAARSPVFKAQLFGPMKDHDAGVFHIKDIEAPVFKAMLHFIYYDSLPNDDEFEGLSPSASTDMAQHLLAAAHYYGLDRLRLICESRLCQDITAETVATTLTLAEQHHCSHLKRVCLKFVAANLSDVLKSEGYQHLRQSCPSLQFDLLKAISGVNEDHDFSRNRDSSEDLSDGADVNGRRVKQRT